MVEKTIELTGTSANSIEDAVNLAVSRAAVTIEGIRRAEIAGVTATVENGSVASWRVQGEDDLRHPGSAARVGAMRRTRRHGRQGPRGRCRGSSWCTCRCR